MVVVADREGDIYAGFARHPVGVDLIVEQRGRALHDGGRLFAAPATWPELARTEVLVAPSRAGGCGRIATVVLRAGPVVIWRPRHDGDRADPRQLTLHMVEARGINGPAAGQPLLWRLLTTLDVISAADAQEIVRLYRLRWRIEAVFRELKSELGLRPVFHQKDDRTEGYLFIAVLAYQLVQVIRRKLAAQGEHLFWSGLRVICD